MVNAQSTQSTQIAKTGREGSTPTLFELVALEGLPCGCVAAAYRADPFDFGLISLEAKGPHCVYDAHRQGRVLKLGRLDELVDKDEEE